MANCDVTTKLSVTNNEAIEIERKMRGILFNARLRKLSSETLKKQFQVLIESYKDYMTKDIAGTFSEVSAKLGINSNYEIFFSPQGIMNILSSGQEHIPVENPPVILDVKQVQQRREVRNKAFMLEAYKDATSVRQKVEKEISVALVNSTLLNRLEGKAVNSINAMNLNIRNYLLRLLNTIAKVILDKLEQGGQYKRIPAILKNPVMYKDGQYTGAVEQVLKYDTMLNFTADLLIEFSNNPSLKYLLDAYNAKVILTHFDSLMSSRYGKNIVIKDFGDGKFSGTNKYSWAKKGASATDGFANPEEMMIESLVDNKLLELIMATPLLNYASTDQIGYLQVADFSNVLGRLKEFAWNGSDYKIPESLRDNLLHESTRNLAKEYSLVQMINRIRDNGSIFLPAIFEILSTPEIYENIESTNPLLLKQFPPQYKQIVYSIYKGIFSDSGNSVNSITKGKLSRTLFNEIVALSDSIYGKKFMQYNEVDNVITARDMSESNFDLNERLIRTKVNTINSKLIKRFENGIAKEFELKYEDFVLKVSRNGEKIAEIANNGKVTKFVKFEKMEDLINKVLGTPITNEIIKSMGYKNIISAQEAIQDMALRSLYLAWVNQNHSKDAENFITLEGDEKVRKNTLGEIDMIHKKDVTTIQDLASAISIQQGVFSSSQVKDGSGNARSISGLSYLIGSINSQLELQNRSKNSATKNSLYVVNPGIFKGIYDSKEVVTTANGAKTSTEWNVGEFITSSFIYDFIGGMIGTGHELLKQGTIAILASVNSDKNTISKLLVDLNAKIPQFNKTLGLLNNMELVQLINKEFGDIYINTLNNIETDLNNLFLYHGLRLSNLFLNNFKDFNKYFELNRQALAEFNSPTEYLRYLIREYNLDNNENPIHLIDLVHYIDKKGIPSSNQTLLSLIARFNPQFLTERGIDISKYPTDVQFWNYKAAELIQSLFTGKFNVNFDAPTKQINYLKTLLSSEWIDNGTNQMIWAKVTVGNNTINLMDSESEFELRQALGLPENSDLGEDLRQALNEEKVKIKLNPQIARYNFLDYFASLEHMISTVGSHIAHPAKGDTTNEMSTGLDFLREEAARFNAQHKRNVSFTATMSEFTLNLRNGIPSTYNVAVIDDINDFVHTIGGVEEKTNPFDGATFVNPFLVYLENNSLGAAKVGLTKKLFVHAYDERTGTGVIIKTAGFALTNNVIRNSKLLQNLSKKMTDIGWNNFYDITKDENGNRIVYGTEGQGGENYLYYKKNGEYYAIRTSGIYLAEDGRYMIPTMKIDRTGKILTQEEKIPTNINSNYLLWEAFGGYNSMTMTNKGLVFGEESIEAVVEAINNVARYGSNGQLEQPLKTSDIHYLATAGAVKQGAANINSKSSYYDNTPFDFFKIKMYQAGVQLDKEHHADNSELALMTLVISACAHLGFTGSDAMEIYNALYTLTLQGTADLLDSFLQYTGEKISRLDFQAIIINNIFKQIALLNVDENNLITTIARDLVEKVKKGLKLSKEEALSLPVDDNAIYNQFISKLAVYLTDSGIRMKIPGILAVLNPSYECIKLYGDRKLEEISNIDEIQNTAPQVVNELGEVNYKHLKFGRTYRVVYNPEYQGILPELENGLFEVRKVYDRKLLRNLIKAGAILECTEDYTVGRNLGSYDATFIDEFGQTNSIWDLDSVEALYAIRDARTIEDLQVIREKYRDRWNGLNDNTFNLLNSFTSYSNYLEKILRRWTRHDNAMFSKKRGDFFDDTSVWMDGKLVNIDLNTVEITPYELGLPKIFATEFGLDESASVYEISHNPNYFTERILLNIKAKSTDNKWDYCLKRLNGSHVYILDEKNLIKTNGLSEVEISKINYNNRIYRTNEFDENIYQMASEKDKVFTDGANEIIVTSKPEWYLDKMSYNILSINPNKDALAFEKAFDVVNKLESNNHGLERYIEYLGENRGDWFNKNQAIESPSTNPKDLMNLYSRLGSELWTSFMLTLDAVASRTPSQSMQSVMSMKIAFFDNENLNNAWVNSDLFFLQGSDLDIDAVSIALYGVARNGKVPIWSPYADYTIGPAENPMANIKLSLEFSFPTGKKAERILYQTPKEAYYRTLELYNKYKDLFINKIENIVEVKFLNNFSGKLPLLQELINDVNKNGIPTISLGVADLIGKSINPNLIEQGSNFIIQLLNKIENVVNKHNLFLGTLTEENLELIAKNYNMFKMFSISNDPINLIQSQSSVDSMTSTAKNIANSSPSANLAKSRTPGNFVNKYESIRDNQVGAKGIGICAVGLKGFFGLTQYNNMVLNSDENALTRLRLGSKGLDFYIPRLNKFMHYDYLANINPTKNSPLANIDPVLYLKFREKGFDNDAALQLSALLSLATDNAKELALAKLNASDKTLGMYIYGLSIGMEFEDISSLLMSPVGVTLTSVMEGNAFKNDRGIFNLDGVFNYFEIGPRDLILKNKIGFNYLSGSLVSGLNFDTVYQLAKYAWNNKELSAPTGPQSPEFRRAFRLYSTYFRQVQLIKNNINTYNSLKQLYFGADEMRHLGAIFGLNQGLATRTSDIIGKLIDIERIFSNRAAIINSESRRNKIRSSYKDSKIDKYNYPKISPNSFNLNEFIKNPQPFIDSYERIKHSFNILDAVNTVPHFRGYFEMLNLLDLSAKNSGHKYADVRQLLNKVINSKTPKDEISKLVKKIEWFYNDYLKNQWMLDNEFTFDLENGARVFDNNFLYNGKYTDKGGRIILGTKWGNASYKYYIENILIPKLQSDPLFMSNTFIKNLQPDIVSLTVDHIPRVYSVLGINMMPNIESERAIFNEYKAAFNSIADNKVRIGNKDISLRNAFYLYGLIAHYGKQGRSSLMPIFENQHNREMVDNFHKYLSKFEGIPMTEETLREMEPYVIPYKNPYQATEEKVYWKDSEGQFRLYYKVSYEVAENRDDSMGRYIPQTFKYSDEQVRNYDMASTDTGVKTYMFAPVSTKPAEKIPLIIKNGKFKGGKLNGIDVPYLTNPVTRELYVDENDVRKLLNELDC